MKEPEIILRELSVPGSHMRTNLLNAALVMYLMNVAPEKIISILGSWQGITHRLQYFHSWKCGKKEYKFYNDSCATVPEAAAMATQAFGKSVTLLTGGTDKGLDLAPLVKVLTKPEPFEHEVKGLYFLSGTATDKILPAIEDQGRTYYGDFDSLDQLLTCLKNNIEKEAAKADKNEPAPSDASPEVIVFSPGATSFGMFNNEFDRGEQFMKKVRERF